MSRMIRGIALAASCAAIAATLPAVAQKPGAAKLANSCETLCFQRHGTCLNNGTDPVICDRQLEACLGKCP